MDIDNTPIFKLEELEAHLQELVTSPDVPINTGLFDAVELQLTGMCFVVLYSTRTLNQAAL